MDAFDEFFRESYDTVRRSLRLIVSDANRAEDLAQEAFARAWRHWRSVSSMERPVAWVYAVAINHERKQWRHERPRGETAWQPTSEPDLARSVVTGVRLGDALASLTGRQRSAVVLRYFADLPVAEVASVMRCADGTVKATLHQALHRLRIELEGDDAS